MDQYLNNRQNEILWSLLANPADNGHLHAYNLQCLASDFPQSGLLHALLCRADSEQNISHAAAYLNPKALYLLVNSPESLAVLTDSRIIQQLSDNINYATVEEVDRSQQENEESGRNDFNDALEAKPDFSAESESAVEEVNHGQPAIDSGQEQGHIKAEREAVAAAQGFAETESVIAHGAGVEAAGSPADEPQTVGTSNEENNKSEDSAQNIREDESVTEAPSFELAEPPRGIEDDVYDEIVGIEDISFSQAAKPAGEITPSEQAPLIGQQEELTETPLSEPRLQRERVLNMDDEAEKLIVGNIAATDYFVFDRAFNDRKQAETAEKNSFVPASGTVNGHVNTGTTSLEESQEVSKYNDDTMPYTFLWWLNKTRREHAGIYQPFKLDTSQAIRQAGADELQQQYYENIFHLGSVEELDRSTPQRPIEFDPKSKEDRIIKRFIVEEPHITPPSGDKLDNENKARKSAEDRDELVTETLAQIYIDQMLYHKAIITYKKLMLKFPEKSRYFADQIEQLERKTN
ncbi:MAG: hypothetical protein JWP78_926 [Mucilaginibacter sp.]|nr:hypothetical protein [Mucilaginibacter sp.]